NTPVYLGTSLFSNMVTFPSTVLLSTMILLYTIYNIKKPIDLLIDEVNDVANGNLVIQRRGLDAFGEEFAHLEDNFMLMTEQLQDIVSGINLAATKLVTSSEELASSSEEISASTEEISSAVQQMNYGAQQQSNQLNGIVINVQDFVNATEEVMENISGAVDIISEVARQSSILALNASIEAARAGDYGKGFAVVADNVRRLAEDTKLRTVMIQDLIVDIQNQIKEKIDTIFNSVNSVATVAEETAANSEETASAIEEQAATVEEMSIGSQELANMAEELTASVSKFSVTSTVSGKTIMEPEGDRAVVVEKTRRRIEHLIKRVAKS
ncbi:MAG: methyl-accepting chemotaxis protein, partial [Candidatus Odinarchaeota archaeon]